MSPSRCTAVPVLLVDDDVMFRQGLRLLIEGEDVCIVGEASDGKEALWYVTQHRPAVVLMDLRMPGLSGIEATRLIGMLPNPPRVVALTTFDDDELVFEALRAGAVSYLLKDADADAIVYAVQSAARGASVIPPSVVRKVVDEFARLSHLDERRLDPESASLSKRETEVLRFLARGASNKEIALRLNIGHGTVRNHLTSVYRKLRVTDRLQAAMRAREYGIV